MEPPFTWLPIQMVTTNTFVKEILTYKGKKGAAEMSYTYSPATRTIEVIEATVSNRNGTVSRLTPKEVNLLDANWVASAPRYPASKKLMVNLPGVEVGSVIRATVVKTVTNAPVAYTGQFTFDSVDPVDRVEVEMHVKIIADSACGVKGGSVLYYVPCKSSST